MDDGAVLELGLADWMEHRAVPGVSLAVIDDYEVVWTQGFGIRLNRSGIAQRLFGCVVGPFTLLFSFFRSSP